MSTPPITGTFGVAGTRPPGPPRTPATQANRPNEAGSSPAGAASSGHATSGVQGSWQRPWENMRDRATYAMGFSSAFATDAFLELSRTFLQAIQTGEVENQPAHSTEATIRLDDVYHLHRLARGSHVAVAETVGAIGPRRCRTLQQSLGACAVLALLTLVVVHLSFMSPFMKLAAAGALSRAVYEAGAWNLNADETCRNSDDRPPVIVRLEVLNASWPQQWLRPYVMRLQQASLEARERNELAELQQRTIGAGGDRNASVAQSLGSMLFPRFADLAIWSYDMAFPTPRFEFTYGTDYASWLEVQSPKARAMLGVSVVDLQLSARDPIFFGPQWARELLSLLRLYDLYVLHAVPLHFLSFRNSSVDDIPLYAAVVAGQPQGMLLAPVTNSVTKAGSLWWQLRWAARRTFSACLVLPITLACAVLLSAFLRRLAVLSVRMQVYSSCTVRQMRRYAFIAEPLRRINCYSSNELLELWTAWAACMGLVIWILSEALYRGAAWSGILLCYVLAEYWGIVHVRTLQSRWIFPRAVLLLHSGAVAYATWWPLCPGWLVFWSLASSQIWLMFHLLCTFDCFATLPEQTPHRLLFRSVLLPAARMDRSPVDVPAASPSPVAPAPTVRLKARMRCTKATQTDETSDACDLTAPVLSNARESAAPTASATTRMTL